MNRDNFEYQLGEWHVVMNNGELEINDCSYDPQDQDQDPNYTFARELAKLKGLINE